MPPGIPEGRYLAFSVNEIQQYFHSTGPKAVEVSDSESDLLLLDTKTNRLISSPAIYGKEWMETFPTWSPDGINALLLPEQSNQ